MRRLVAAATESFFLIREAAKKVIFLSGPTVKPPPPLSGPATKKEPFLRLSLSLSIPIVIANEEVNDKKKPR